MPEPESKFRRKTQGRNGPRVLYVGTSRAEVCPFALGAACPYLAWCIALAVTYPAHRFTLAQVLARMNLTGSRPCAVAACRLPTAVRRRCAPVGAQPSQQQEATARVQESSSYDDYLSEDPMPSPPGPERNEMPFGFLAAVSGFGFALTGSSP